MALSALLSKLRTVLGDAALEGRKDLTLNLPPDALIDVESAVNAIHRAEALISGERWTEAAGATLTAYSISERQFLRGESAPWVDDNRRRLEEINLRAVESYTRIGLGVGGAELPVAVQSARGLVARAPYRESGYCLLMRALEGQGNVVEAMRVYEELRIRLRDDLGASPSGPHQTSTKVVPRSRHLPFAIVREQRLRSRKEAMGWGEPSRRGFSDCG